MKRLHGALLVAALLLVGAACDGSDDDDGPAAAVPTSAPDPEPLRLELPSPDWLAADDEFVYVKLDGGRVLRLDPGTGETLGTTEIRGSLCQGLGVAFDAVWSCLDGDLARIDPATDSVVATIPVGKAADQGNLVGRFGRLWVLVGDGSDLVAIDPETNEPGPAFPLGVRGTDLAVDDEHVWVVSGPDRTVVRVDPATGSVTGRVEGLVGPRTIVATAAGVWVGSGDQTVRVDPATLEVVATVAAGPGAHGALAVDGDDLWVRSSETFLTRVDAADGSIRERLTEDVTSGGDVIIAFGAVWATAYDDAALLRIPVEGD